MIPISVIKLSVPAKRASIDHKDDEKSELESIDWTTNFVVQIVKI